MPRVVLDQLGDPVLEADGLGERLDATAPERLERESCRGRGVVGRRRGAAKGARARREKSNENKETEQNKHTKQGGARGTETVQAKQRKRSKHIQQGGARAE